MVFAAFELKQYQVSFCREDLAELHVPARLQLIYNLFQTYAYSFQTTSDSSKSKFWLIDYIISLKGGHIVSLGLIHTDPLTSLC